MSELEPYRPITVRRPAQPVEYDPERVWTLRDMTEAAARVAALGPQPERGAAARPAGALRPLARIEPELVEWPADPIVELREVPKELVWLLGAEAHAKVRHRRRFDLVVNILGVVASVALLLAVAWVTFSGLVAWGTR